MATGRTPFKNRSRDRRYQAIIEQAAEHPWGTVHVIPVRYPDETVSRRHASKIRDEARYQGYAKKIGWHVHEDGTVTISFRIWPVEHGRRHIADNPQKIRWNTRRKGHR